MRFPVQKDSSKAAKNAKAGQCLVCHCAGVHKPNDFAYLNGGGLRILNKDNSVMAPDLEGFLSIGFHGGHSETHSNPDARLDIADNARFGQFELYFCSTACLRKFFGLCVDALEQELSRKTTANRRSSGRGDRTLGKSKSRSARRLPKP